MLVDEKAKLLKIFCPLCRFVFQDPYVSSCGVSGVTCDSPDFSTKDIMIVLFYILSIPIVMAA